MSLLMIVKLVALYHICAADKLISGPKRKLSPTKRKKIFSPQFITYVYIILFVIVLQLDSKH